MVNTKYFKYIEPPLLSKSDLGSENVVNQAVSKAQSNGAGGLESG